MIVSNCPFKKANTVNVAETLSEILHTFTLEDNLHL